MRTLLDATTRRRHGANARRAVLPLSPAAITLQLVLLYRDLLAATVQAKAAARSNRNPQTVAGAPSTRSAETMKPAPPGTAPEAASGNVSPVAGSTAGPTASDAPAAAPAPPDAAAPDESPPR